MKRETAIQLLNSFRAGSGTSALIRSRKGQFSYEWMDVEVCYYRYNIH